MNIVETKPRTSTSKRLAGKVAVVTGGSRGIGAAIAQRLADEGATVALTYNKNKELADKVVAGIKETGGKAVAIKSDASSENDTTRFTKELEQAVGKIDILVNNAGVFEGGPVDQINVEQYHRIFDVNVKGVIATTIAALKLLRDGGRIINISSGVSTLVLPGFSIYSASKAALDALTRVWAQDLGPRGITVNSVNPGTTVTDMFNQTIPEGAHADIIGKTALRRLGQPYDIASVVLFLASSESGWVTGQAIRTDGGLNL